MIIDKVVTLSGDEQEILKSLRQQKEDASQALWQFEVKLRKEYIPHPANNYVSEIKDEITEDGHIVFYR